MNVTIRRNKTKISFMKIWEIEGERHPMYGERSYGRGSYNQHDSEYSMGYEAGCEAGYREAMKHVYGERSIHRSGEGLGREVYMRDPYMMDYEDYAERRRRDRMGRYM